jgi:transposase InsO family protein
VRFAFIKRDRGRCPVGLACRLLSVSRSGYYAWTRRPACARRQRQEERTEKIRRSFEQSRRRYGSPRVTAELRAGGEKISRKTVEKLMRIAGLRVARRRRFVPRTTDSRHADPIADNKLSRDFAARRPNDKWVCDITYIPTRQGWLYLAVVMDLFSRKIVGYSIRDHLRVELVAEALCMAIRRRKPAAGLLHHSDRGCQYASSDYRQILHGHGIDASMSRRGNCYDNAAMESFFGTLKTELVNDADYATHQEAWLSLFEWIEVVYNRQRRHSALAYLSPETFEARIN